jgi:hypothetical protein
LTPVLVQLIATGRLDLGGGEKDLVWVIPWFLWSLIFAVTSLFLWHRRWSAARSFTRSALAGLGGVLLAAVILALLGQLGVAGRF